MMTFNFLEILQITVSFFLSISLAFVFTYFLKVEKIFSLVLFLWHLFFSLVFCLLIIITKHGDAITYFYNTREYVFDHLGVGTYFVVFLTQVLRWFLDSFWAISVLFGVSGYIGSLFLYAALKESAGHFFYSNIYKLLIYLFVFLPSLNLWTSGIGKDSIIYMALCIIIWTLLNPIKRKYFILFSILLIAFIRPHIAMLLLGSISLSIVLFSNIKISLKLIMLTFSLVLLSLSYSFVLEYVGVGDRGISGVNKYIESREESNLNGGGAVNLANMNFFMKLVTYLYRPFLFEGSSLGFLLSSVDNLILVCLTIYLIRFFKVSFLSIFSIRFSFIYFLFALIVLSATTANLGISMRQKWMLLPFLYYVLMCSYSEFKNRKNNV
ncbi:hypothetical protein [Photobacterium phosphoreum]|uniref:hypothetical protein n=1 Tax=Photobacterium phosphoreum TaxID=659 RepID=UPI0007F8AD47|nr:hypothetical protein [Photobacterium phosphoreum]OBU38014.1 hypothetical protein AYY24_01855 [Photobacterium phosphoreum]PSW38840.1 hypothetical protein CTM87_00655 [Photobacterium phosphoreum]